MRDEFLRRFEDLHRIRSYCVFQPDFIIPSPEDVYSQDDFLLTPFPFFLEAPLLNPCVSHEEIVREICEKGGVVRREEVGILLEILEKKPEALNEELFLKQLHTLTTQNTELVTGIGKVLFEKNLPFYQRFIRYFIENIELSLYSLEVIYKLVKSCKVEQELLDNYLKGWIEKCKKQEGNEQVQCLSLISTCVTELIQENFFDPSSSLELWISFCSHFKTDKCVTQLHKMIKQTLKVKELK